MTCVDLTSMDQYGDLFYLPFQVKTAFLSALLDSGASRSFISSQMVVMLATCLTPIDIEPLQVSLPNVDKIVSKAAHKLAIQIEKINLEVILYEVNMKQNFIFGSDFCQEFQAVVDFSNMELSLTVGSTVVTVQLLKEELGLELNEVKEMSQNNLLNFCKEVSWK